MKIMLHHTRITPSRANGRPSLDRGAEASTNVSGDGTASKKFRKDFPKGSPIHCKKSLRLYRVMKKGLTGVKTPVAMAQDMGTTEKHPQPGLESACNLGGTVVCINKTVRFQVLSNTIRLGLGII